jgi:uncharacterized protein (UPF0335 family)
MNLPKFNLANLPTQVDSNTYLKAVVAEENRVCCKIDKRISVLEDEFIAMAGEMKQLTTRLYGEGFFARMLTRVEIKKLSRRLDDNRTMRNELTTARWRRTYGA